MHQSQSALATSVRSVESVQPQQGQTVNPQGAEVDGPQDIVLFDEDEDYSRAFQVPTPSGPQPISIKVRKMEFVYNQGSVVETAADLQFEQSDFHVPEEDRFPMCKFVVFPHSALLQQ